MIATWLVAVLLLTAQQPATNAGTASITGEVRLAGSRNGVAEARVTLTGPGVREATAADSAGRFTFASVTPGTYRITVEKETYAFDLTAAPLVAVAARATTSVTIEMHRAATIVGEVRDERGNPRRGVPVTPMRKVASGIAADQRRPQATNDLGEFRLDGLLPGDYIVLASPPVPPAGTEALLPTYYPATTDRDAASTVKVGPGETVGAYITMVSTPAFEISGRVVDEQGQPLGRVMVAFVSQTVQTRSANQAGLQASVQAFTTRDDGTFRITGLGPGTYRLTPSPAPTGSPGKPTLSFLTTVITGNSSTVNVDVRDANVVGVVVTMRAPQPQASQP